MKLLKNTSDSSATSAFAATMAETGVSAAAVERMEESKCQSIGNHKIGSRAPPRGAFQKLRRRIKLNAEAYPTCEREGCVGALREESRDVKVDWH